MPLARGLQWTVEAIAHILLSPGQFNPDVLSPAATVSCWEELKQF
jgi:hypothetical protein